MTLGCIKTKWSKIRQISDTTSIILEPLCQKKKTNAMTLETISNPSRDGREYSDDICVARKSPTAAVVSFHHKIIPYEDGKNVIISISFV